MSEGRKDDLGKLRYDLIPPDALREVVKVYTFGAQKYDDRNWEQGIKYGRVYAAAQRHLQAWLGGEENDPESDLSHMAHAAWNCLALLAYELRGLGQFDDRGIIESGEVVEMMGRSHALRHGAKTRDEVLQDHCSLLGSILGEK